MITTKSMTENVEHDLFKENRKRKQIGRMYIFNLIDIVVFLRH
jgi:hypothetical protein